MFLEITLSLIQGFGITLLIFILTLVIALPLGLGVSFCSMSKFKPIKYLTKAIVWVIRGTPLMLQVIVVYYGPGLWFHYPMRSQIIAVVIAFVINYAAYFSEIFRGGIESIPKGQYEAGMVLGLTRSQIFFKIILMQVVKRTIAPLGNEVITLVKDTSLAKVIAVGEIIMMAEDAQSMYAIMWPLFYAGLFFLIFNGILTVLFSMAEKKLSYYKI